MATNRSAFLVALLLTGPRESAAFGFDFFSRTNTGNVTLPMSKVDAAALGWMPAVREDGSPCRDGLGLEYTEDGTTTSESRPLSLFFEAGPLGRLSAMSVRAWFKNATSFNPESWQMPSFGAATSERWVTVTTRDPASVCDASSQKPSESILGDRLVFNFVSSSDAGVMEIPTAEPSDPDGSWKQGACMPNMSRHWGYPLDGEAETLLGLDHGEKAYLKICCMPLI